MAQTLGQYIAAAQARRDAEQARFVAGLNAVKRTPTNEYLAREEALRLKAQRIMAQD